VDVVSTFVTGDDRFVGAITAVHGDDPIRLTDDPFALIFPAALVRVGPGLLGTTPAPVGPVIRSSGSATSPRCGEWFGDAAVGRRGASGEGVGATELGIDAWHHAVYAITTTVAYRFLDRSSSVAVQFRKASRSALRDSGERSSSASRPVSSMVRRIWSR
jgi:hypothetical protein